MTKSTYQFERLVAGEQRIRVNRPVAVQRVLELGPRETALLQALWQRGEATASEIHGTTAAHSVTVNTIHSALERLYRKGFVERSKEGRAFRYRPAVQQSELIGYCLRLVAERLAAGSKQEMVHGIADYLERSSPETRSQLQRLLLRRLSRD